MWIARKTAKLITCLGGSSQFRQSIVHTINRLNVTENNTLISIQTYHYLQMLVTRTCQHIYTHHY